MDDSLVYTLKNMGIYDLRNFARSVGVAKPTTLKRQELINAILDIKTGITQPTLGVSRGRKPKNKESANELFNKYSNDYIDYTNSLIRLSPEIATNMPKQTYVSSSIQTNKTTYLKMGKAVIEDNEDGYFLTSTNSKVIIPKSFIARYDIKNGEDVSATCIKDDNDVFVVIDVYNRPCVLGAKFEELKLLSKTKKINLKDIIFYEFNKNFSINCGQCVEVNYDVNVAPEKVASTLLENILNNNTLEVSSIFTDEFNTPNILNKFEKINLILCLEDVNLRINAIEKIISEMKKDVENNKNCVLLIGNISLLVSAYKEYYILQGYSQEMAKVMSIKQIMSIFALSRQTERGSLTMFVLNAQNNFEEFIPLFNARLCFENNGIIKLGTKSYSIY